MSRHLSRCCAYNEIVPYQTSSASLAPLYMSSLLIYSGDVALRDNKILLQVVELLGSNGLQVFPVPPKYSRKQSAPSAIVCA